MFKKSSQLLMVMVLIAVMVLSACSSSSEGNNASTNAPTNGGVAEAESGENEGGAVVKGKIQYSTWGNKEEKAMEEAVVKAFNEQYPDIEVELIHVDGSYEQKLQTMIAGGGAPDVISIGGGHILSFSNAFQELSMHTVNVDAYISRNLVDAFQLDGMQYALPKRVNTNVFAYNKELLAKAQVEPPSGEFTIEEFQEKAIKVAALGGEGQQKVFGSDPLWFGQWLYQFGGQFVTKDKKQATVNSDEAKKALQFVIDASRTHHFAPNTSETEGQNTMDWFLSGRVGFKAGFGPYLLPLMKQSTKFDWDVAIQPGKGGEMEIVGLAVSKESKNQEAATLFAQFVSNSDEAQKIIATGSNLPVTNAGKDVFLAQFPDKNLNAFFEAMEHQTPQVSLKQAARFNDTFYKAIYDRTALGASGSEDPSKVLDEVNEELTRLLQ